MRTYKSRSRKSTTSKKRAYARAAARRAASRALATRRFRTRPSRLPLASQPQRKLVRLRYQELIAINPGAAGAIGTYQFRANGIFDPNITSTGHQPMGHDEWAQFYNHYTVLGSKITVTGMGDTASEAIIFGVYLSDDTTVPALLHELIENGKSGYRYTGSVWKTATKISRKYSAKRFFNISDPKDNTNLRAPFGSDPTEQAVYSIWCRAMDSTTDPANMYFNVVIEYICALHERKDLSAS